MQAGQAGQRNERTERRAPLPSENDPFGWEELAELRADAPSVVRRIFPGCEALYAAEGWKLFPSLDRVYVNEPAPPGPFPTFNESDAF